VKYCLTTLIFVVVYSAQNYSVGTVLLVCILACRLYFWERCTMYYETVLVKNLNL